MIHSLQKCSSSSTKHRIMQYPQCYPLHEKCNGSNLVWMPHRWNSLNLTPKRHWIDFKNLLKSNKRSHAVYTLSHKIYTKRNPKTKVFFILEHTYDRNVFTWPPILWQHRLFVHRILTRSQHWFLFSFICLKKFLVV